MAEGFSGRRGRRPPRRLYEPKKPRKPCKFFLQGTCKKGRDCLFVHDVGQKVEADSGRRNPARDLPDEEISVPHCLGYIVGKGCISLKKLERECNVRAKVHWTLKKIDVSGSKQNIKAFREKINSRLENMIVDYVEVPEAVSMHYVVGRGGHTLSRLSEKEDDTYCVPCVEKDRRMVKIMSSSSSSIEMTKKRLKTNVFTTSPILDSVTCLDTTKTEFQICFQPHRGHFSSKSLYETIHTLRLARSPRELACDSECPETVLEKGIEQMRLVPLSKDAFPEQPKLSETARALPSGSIIHQDNVLFIRQCIFDCLQSLKKEDYKGQIRIEGRIGKMGWPDLPSEIASSSFDMLEFQEQCASHLRSSFSPFISSSLKDVINDLDQLDVVETYDFKMSTKRHRRIDLRVGKTPDGRLSLSAAYESEMKRLVANWIFLEKHYDVRISLNTRQFIPFDDPEVAEFVQSLKMIYGQLTFHQAGSSHVHFVRHKVKSSYTFDHYSLDITKIQEFSHPGTKISPDFTPTGSHYEVELRNLNWIGLFSSSAPNVDVEEFFRILQCPYPRSADFSGKPWEAKDVVEELPDFIESLLALVDNLKPTDEM